MGNQIDAGDKNGVGLAAADEGGPLLEGAHAGNARRGNALRRAATIQPPGEIGGEESRLDVPLGDAGNRLTPDQFVQRLDIGLGGRKHQSAAGGGYGIQDRRGIMGGLVQRGDGEKKGARIGMFGIGGLKLADAFIGDKTGDDRPAGFADEAFAGPQGGGIGCDGAQQGFQPGSVGAERAATGDGGGGSGHGSFHRASHDWRRSSTNGGHVNISSPAGVVKTWLVLPVASSAPPAWRRIS